MGYQAVRDNRYKYIHYVDLDGADELYDLVSDPYELQNLIDHPEYARTLKKMKKELKQLLIQTGANRIN